MQMPHPVFFRRPSRFSGCRKLAGQYSADQGGARCNYARARGNALPFEVVGSRRYDRYVAFLEHGGRKDRAFPCPCCRSRGGAKCGPPLRWRSISIRASRPTPKTPP